MFLLLFFFFFFFFLNIIFYFINCYIIIIIINIIVIFDYISTDKDVIERNVSMKLRSPDYIHMNPEQAIADFKARMANYEKAYQPVSEETEGEDIRYFY